MRPSVGLLAVMVSGVAAAQTPTDVSQRPERITTVPGVRCDSARADTLPDSAIISFNSVDVPPRLLSAVTPAVPGSVGHTAARTVLELVVDRMGRLDACHVRVLEETSPAWTDAILHALKKARYSPAQRYGLDVAVRFRQTFTARRY